MRFSFMHDLVRLKIPTKFWGINYLNIPLNPLVKCLGQFLSFRPLKVGSGRCHLVQKNDNIHWTK